MRPMSTREVALSLIFGIVGIVAGMALVGELIRSLLALVGITVTVPQSLMIVVCGLILVGFAAIVWWLWRMMTDSFLHLRLELRARRAQKEP